MTLNAAIPWFEPVIEADDVAAVNAVVSRGFVNEGPEIRAFEEELCHYFGSAHAVATPSCTMALALALMAHGIGHGDSVLVPSVTFIGTASAVRLTGAEVVLVDVDPDTFVMDPAHARRRLKSNARAIIPVHLTGRSANMDELGTLCREKGLILIEDAAEALGSRNAHGFLGAQSVAGCFSLAPTKIITSGQGGFILTPSSEIHDQLIRLRDHGRLSRASDEHPVVGFNFKVTDMQGALARSQFTKLPARIARAREIDRRYENALAEVKEITRTPRPREGYLMWPDFKSIYRDKIVDQLKRQGITLRPYWPALHRQPAYRDDPREFPGAEIACTQACWLPCSPNITDPQIDQVIYGIREVIRSA
jgi:perosamine synthetase